MGTRNETPVAHFSALHLPQQCPRKYLLSRTSATRANASQESRTTDQAAGRHRETALNIFCCLATGQANPLI